MFASVRVAMTPLRPLSNLLPHIIVLKEEMKHLNLFDFPVCELPCEQLRRDRFVTELGRHLRRHIVAFEVGWDFVREA